MKRKPLQQLSLISVLRELANFSEPAFVALLEEVQGPQAFDTDKRRLSKIVAATGTDEETLSLMLSALNFLYSEIHSESGTIDVSPEVIRDLISNLEKSPISFGEEKISDIDRASLENRLPMMLEKKPSTDKFRKAERLRAGFLPAAISFASFVDLRPLLSEDQMEIEELIPLIQFRIRTDSGRPDLKNIVFQMDTSSLQLLKEAIEAAEHKLASVARNNQMKNLIANN